MIDVPTKLSWKAHEYFHQDKSVDWYWGLGIVATTCAILAIVFGNTLFALIIVLFAFVAGMRAHREPRLLDFELTTRGVVIDHILYPYTTLESFSVGEQHLKKRDPQVIVKSKKLFMPHIHVPVEEIDIEIVRAFLLQYLEETEHDESLLEKTLEHFGF
jgi:hypothetical protein